ncbi:MAG: SIMPL domain-containing protein [Bacillota bacterium]
MDTAVFTGANKVNQINFDLEDPQELKMQAFKVVTEQAAQKAEAIVESADKSIVDGLID